MLDVILVMIAGMVTGFLLRKKEALFVYIDNLIMGSIFLLLFFLGVSVGLNETVIKNMHVIGMKSLLITASAVAGSVILSSLVYTRVFKRKKHEK